MFICYYQITVNYHKTNPDLCSLKQQTDQKTIKTSTAGLPLEEKLGNNFSSQTVAIKSKQTTLNHK